MAEASKQARAPAEQPSALSHLISKCCEELVLSQVLKTKFTCGLDNSQAAKSIIIQLCFKQKKPKRTVITPCAYVQILTWAIFSQYFTFFFFLFEKMWDEVDLCALLKHIGCSCLMRNPSTLCQKLSLTPTRPTLQKHINQASQKKMSDLLLVMVGNSACDWWSGGRL